MAGDTGGRPSESIIGTPRPDVTVDGLRVSLARSTATCWIFEIGKYLWFVGVDGAEVTTAAEQGLCTTHSLPGLERRRAGLSLGGGASPEKSSRELTADINRRDTLLCDRDSVAHRDYGLTQDQSLVKIAQSDGFVSTVARCRCRGQWHDSWAYNVGGTSCLALHAGNGDKVYSYYTYASPSQTALMRVMSL